MSRKNRGCDSTLKINTSCHFGDCAKINLHLVTLVVLFHHADTYFLLQLIHSPGDVFLCLLLIFLDHGLLQVLLQLLVQLFTHTKTYVLTAHYIETQKSPESMTVTGKYVRTVDFAADEIYGIQD